MDWQMKSPHNEEPVRYRQFTISKNFHESQERNMQKSKRHVFDKILTKIAKIQAMQLQTIL